MTDYYTCFDASLKKSCSLELDIISEWEAISCILLDINMRLVRAINRYLKYLKLKVRADGTLNKMTRI